MKIKVTLKDPDALSDAIDHTVKDEVKALGLDLKESAGIEQNRRDKAHKAASRWFMYSEYLTVEIDTEAGTCTVVPA